MAKLAKRGMHYSIKKAMNGHTPSKAIQGNISEKAIYGSMSVKAMHGNNIKGLRTKNRLSFVLTCKTQERQMSVVAEQNSVENKSHKNNV